MSFAQIQKPAPAFSGTAVKEGAFEEIKLSDYLGKWVILVFYPMDFTFVCPTEILAFNKAIEDFKAIGAEIVVSSTDSEFTHLAWSQMHRKEGGLGPDLKLTMKSADKQYADRSHALSKAYGVHLEDEGVSLRGSFFIDPKGILRASHIHDLPVGRSVEESLRVIKAFQFTDEHGEVCPAGWEEGKDTIDTSNKLEYFGKHTEIVNKSEALREVKRKSDSDSKADEGSSKKAKV